MSAPAETPTTLRTAVWLLAFQAVAVTGITIYLLVRDFGAEGFEARLAWAVTAFAVLGAALLGLLARSVARRRRWARDVAVALELTILAPAYFMVGDQAILLAVVVGGTALAIIALLVMPATNRAIGVRA
ncbi:hypothetical protein [Hamadaea tsunoensis]|uniref:hypothetical protein n=1 Tax=Hamadaea tsunoensis TaxID=53368 RepID=UPI0004085781|nr:hypothetical protein [Hamadaea tsunoensis]